MYKDDRLFQMLVKYDFDLNRNEVDVPTFLENHFQKYIVDVEQAAFGNNPMLGASFCSQVISNISFIKDICNSLVDVGRVYRDGLIKDAFERAYKLFASMDKYFILRNITDSKDGYYYRLRQGDFRIKAGEDSKKKKAEMFHIKGNNRHLIKAYRFSVQGFPCLYLTNGFELGWFESGMPKQFSYCRMRIEESGICALRLIDISNRPVDLLSAILNSIVNANGDREKLHRIHSYLLNYIITYPLAIACSLKVSNRGDRFVEEYVIPQMFMSWIRENDSYDGVRYKSSLNTTLVDAMGAVNIALPVKKFRADGLCENLTSKISVSDIAYLDVNENFKQYEKYLSDIVNFKNEIWIKRIRENYCGEYVYKLISICETVNSTYKSIINGELLNEVMLHQIDCIADYVYTIQENRDSIINRSLTSVEKVMPSIDKLSLMEVISGDIDTFFELITNVVHKHMVFTFSKQNVENFEKI